MKNLNTDALRAFLGTAIQTWAPILVLLHVIHLDAEALAAIETAMIVTVNGIYSIFKASPKT